MLVGFFRSWLTQIIARTLDKISTKPQIHNSCFYACSTLTASAANQPNKWTLRHFSRVPVSLLTVNCNLFFIWDVFDLNVTFLCFFLACTQQSPHSCEAKIAVSKMNSSVLAFHECVDMGQLPKPVHCSRAHEYDNISTWNTIQH